MQKNINVYIQYIKSHIYFKKHTKCYIKKCIDYCKILENVEVFTPFKTQHKNNIVIILRST